MALQGVQGKPSEVSSEILRPLEDTGEVGDLQVAESRRDRSRQIYYPEETKPRARRLDNKARQPPTGLPPSGHSRPPGIGIRPTARSTPHQWSPIAGGTGPRQSGSGISVRAKARPTSRVVKPPPAKAVTQLPEHMQSPPRPKLIGQLGTAASTYNYKEWESKRMDAIGVKDEDLEPVAFRPDDFRGPYFPHDPRIVKDPRLKPGPPYNKDETFRRPSSPSSINSRSESSRINLNTEYFSLPAVRPSQTVTRAPFSGTTRRPSRIPVLVKKLAKRPVIKNKNKSGAVIVKPKKDNNTDICSENGLECAGGKNGNLTQPAYLLDFLRGEIWVIPVLVAAGSLMSVLLIFEIFLISKAITANPSRRHLFLGQMLMMGLMLCCAMTVVISLKPTPLTCAVSRIGIGLAYTIIYSTLLVKLVFLISLNSGVYLPATYQCLLLCFAILIQAVIGIQWLMSAPADVLHVTLDNGEVFSTCNVTFQQQILGLLYVIFLVLVVVVLAFKSRGVRENYREAMYIGLTMGFTVCIFTIWILAGFISPTFFDDTCVACGLVASAAITFVIMFMPKGRQLSAMGKEGVYNEDRADVYTGSSTQSTGSGGTPSPSFFPIKPGKLVQQYREKEFHRERMDSPPPSPRKHGKLFSMVLGQYLFVNVRPYFGLVSLANVYLACPMPISWTLSSRTEVI